MDNIQIKVIDAIRAHKDLITDRNKFRGMLADYLLDDKVHLNVLMDAYDEKFPLKIKNVSDKALLAIQHIKLLSENYGISENYAKWSIATWCAVLGLDEISDAINSIETKTDKPNDIINQFSSDDSKDYELGLGTYCAGVDFPAGTLKIQAEWDDRGTILYEVSKKFEFTRQWTGAFIDQTYLKVNLGDFIYFELEDKNLKKELYSIYARKVSD